jgi:ketosteroid isomerase-like protein
VSHKNVEIHRRALEAFNARDLEAFVALCDREIEFHSTFAAVGGARYRGHDGLRRWHRDLEDAWGGGIRVELDVYFDVGEQTLTFGVLYGRGRQSGAAVAMPYAGVVTWRDGLAVDWRAYGHKEEALRDLGVAEDALEPIDP